MTDHVPTEARRRIMRGVGRKDTAPEMAVRRTLHRLGYRFRLHRRDLSGTPDVVFPGRRTAMFVHGCFWHGHDCKGDRTPKTNTAFWTDKIARNRERDARKEAELREAGWRVVTVWECETKDADALATKLGEALGPPGTSRPTDGSRRAPATGPWTTP